MFEEPGEDPGETVERYAERLFHSYQDGEPEGVRRKFIQHFFGAFHQEYDTLPDAIHFADYVRKRHDRLDDPSAVEQRELLAEARDKGPVCVDCLGATSYEEWVESGAEVREDGTPMMGLEEAGIYPSAPSGVSVQPGENEKVVELEYACGEDGHGTHTVLTTVEDEEIRSFVEDVGGDAEKLKDFLDMDDE